MIREFLQGLLRTRFQSRKDYQAAADSTGLSRITVEQAVMYGKGSVVTMVLLLLASALSTGCATRDAKPQDTEREMDIEPTVVAAPVELPQGHALQLAMDLAEHRRRFYQRFPHMRHDLTWLRKRWLISRRRMSLGRAFVSTPRLRIRRVKS